MPDIVITPASNLIQASGGTFVIESVGDNRISLKTNNSNALDVSSGGNFGIGTTNPLNTLMIIQGGEKSGINLSFDGVTNNRTGLFAWTRGSSLASIGGGIEYTALNTFTARSTAASYVAFASGETRFYGNTGLTSGNTFTPTERLCIDSNGSVGIGTSSPSSLLHINGGSLRLAATANQTPFSLYSYNSSESLWFASGNASYSEIHLSPNYAIDFDRSVSFKYTPGTTGAIAGVLTIGQLAKNNANFTHGVTALYTNGTEKLRIASDGNVGIGTSSPLAKLHILGDGGSSNYVYQRWSYTGNVNTYDLLLKQTVTSGVVRYNFSMINASTAYNDVLVFDRGCVGIGTTFPVAKLDIAGNVKLGSTATNLHQVTGSLNIGGSLFNGALTIDRFDYFNIQPYIEGGNFPNNVLYNSGGTPPTFVTMTGSVCPFGKVAYNTSYYEAIGDYIPVNPGETLYGEVWAYRSSGATGTAGSFYVGIARYDKDKNPIAVNLALTYFIASGVTVPSTSTWTKYSGTNTLPLTHTPYNGSDGGPVRYVRPYIIVNYNAGTIPTYWGALKIRKTQLTRDTGAVTISGSVGIGTTTTNASLDVVSNSAATALQIRNRSSNDYGFIVFNNYAGSESSIAQIGAYRTGVNQGSLLLYTGTTEKVRINNDGNVGIGTTSPSQKLDVVGSIRVSGAFYDSNNDAGTSGQILKSTATGTDWVDISTLGVDGTGTANYVSKWLDSNTITNSSIFDNGNVGIGTTSPNGKLTVLGDGSQNTYSGVLRIADTATNKWGGIGFPDTQSLTSTSNNYYLIGRGGAYTDRVMSFHIPYASDYGSGAQPKFGFYSSGADLLHSIEASTGTSYFKGNVGIGTTSPSGKLDVVYGGGTSNFGNTAGGNNFIWSRSSGGSISLFAGGNMGVLSTGNINFYTNQTYGSENFAVSAIITTGGSVGIGTTSPSRPLTVKSNNIGIRMDNTATTNAGLEYYVSSGGNYNWLLGAQYNVSNAFEITPSTTLGGTTYSSPALLVKSDGNIGIGTTSPTVQLDLYSGRFRYRDGTFSQIPNVVSFNLDNNGTGGYAIKTPFLIGTSYEMTIVHVIGYIYGSSLLVDFKVVFYDYGPSSAPINYSMVDNGNDGLPKYLAKDSSGYINICFGGLGDTYYYARFTVNLYTTRYSAGNYAGGWSVTQTTTANYGMSALYDITPALTTTLSNVGIGTRSPAALLNIRASTPTSTGTIPTGTTALVDSNTSNYLTFRNTADNSTYAGLVFLDNNIGGYIVFQNWTSDCMSYGSYQDHIFQNGTTDTINGKTETVRIKQNGNVGIGTSSPAYKLDVVGTTRSTTLLGTTLTDGYITINGGDLLFANDGGGNGFQFDYYNTRMYLGNNAGSTWYMIIQDDGNIGIGTTSPNYKLHVYQGAAKITGPSDLNTGIILSSTSTNIPVVSFRVSDNSERAKIEINNINNANGDRLGFFVYQLGNLNERVSILGGGNVGIGTTSPTARLDIEGTGVVYLDINSTDNSSKEIRFQNNGSTVGYIWQTGGLLGIGEGSSYNSMFVASGGNTGIGTTSPSAKLDVSGSALIDLFTYSQTGGGLYFRRGFVAGSYNLSILAYDHSSGGTSSDGLSINAYDGISICTGANTRQERMRVDYTGNVGIGTTSPAYKLDVNGTGRFASDLYTNGSLVIARAGAYLYINGTNSDSEIIWQANGSNRWAMGMNVGDATENLNIYNYTTSTINFHINKTSGFIGIGTTSPTAKLHVVSSSLLTTSGANLTIATFASSNSNASFLRINERRFSAGSDWTTASTRIQKTIDATDQAYIEFNPSGGAYGLAFGAGTASEAMRIIIGGNVGIGTSSPSAKLHIYDTASSPATGNLLVKSTGGNVSIRMDSNSTSDYTYFTLSQGGTGKFEFGIIPTTSDFYINPNVQVGSTNAAIFIKKADGNVGIGTTSPSQLLDVNGIIKSTRLISTQTTGTSPFTVSSTTVVSNLNADLLDGQHGSYYTESTNGTLPTSWTVGIIEEANVKPFLFNTFGDALAFNTISNLQYWDGSTWQTYTNSGVQEILTGNIQTAVAIVAVTNRKFRFEFSTYSYIGGGVLVVHQQWNNGAHQVSSMLEYWNGSSWVTVITERTSVGGENDYHFYNRANIHGDWSLYRVTITGANTTYPSSYTGIQLLYDYSRQNLPNNFLPIAWDYRKNVGIGTSNTVTRANIYGTLTVDASGQSGNNFSEGIRLGPASNGYSIVTFGVNPASATGTIANQWWIGKHGGTNGFNINSNTTGDVVHILQNGNVGIGTTSPDGKLNVIAANTYTSLRSNAAGSYTFQSIGRTSSELELGVVGAANQFFVGTAAGEGVIKTPASKLHLGYASQTPGITIDTSNNIGIGVVAPSTKLHLSSSATAALRIETRTNSAADSEIEFVGPDTHSYSTGIDTSDSNKFKISYAATRTPPTLGTNDRFILTTAGNVGIGSSTPAAFFDVNGTSKFSGNMGVGAAPSLNARFTITGTSTSQRAVSFSTVSSRSDTTSTSYILTGWIAIYCTSLTGITNGEYYIPFYQYSP